MTATQTARKVVKGSGGHFHLVVETPKGNLVAGMKWFLGTSTAQFNRRPKLFGHLFNGRYKSLVVDAAAG